MKRGFLAFLLAAACTASFAHTGGHPDKARAVSSKQYPFGRAADPAKATRVVAVAMDDTMRYTPDAIEVARGESVRFVLTNRGKVVHEMVIGTMKELREHAEHMKAHPGMEHDEPNMLHVAPGETAELGWLFNRAGSFHFGCLVPGHFEAGMVGRITVK